MAPDQDRSAQAGNLIREYLLGRLDGQKELENRLSEQILYEDDFAEIVAATEDEIIEDYLDARLSGPDREAVDKYFLRPAERKQKLHFARLLRERFQAESPKAASGKPETGTDLGPVSVGAAGAHHGLVFHFRAHVRTYYEIAALLILSGSTFIYMARVHQGMQSEIEAERKNQQLLEGELAQERIASAALSRQLQDLHPSDVQMSFDLSTNRSPSKQLSIKIGTSTQRMDVEFDVKGASAASYDVQLMSGAQELIWSETGLYPSSGMLTFRVPVQGMKTGDYHLVVTQRPQNIPKNYYFHAEVTK